MSVRRFDTISLGIPKNKNKKNKKENCQIDIMIVYFTQCVHKLHYYGDVMHSFDWKSAVEHDGGV